VVTGGEDHFPLTTWEGWQRFTGAGQAEPKLLTAGDLELLSETERAAYDYDRADYHSRLVIVATPVVKQVYAAGRRLILLNRHQVSARRGLIVTGAAGTGKTTAVTQLGRNHELLLRHRLGQPAMAGQMPVAYATVPPPPPPRCSPRSSPGSPAFPSAAASRTRPTSPTLSVTCWPGCAPAWCSTRSTTTTTT
jgi:hypothetical protein